MLILNPLLLVILSIAVVALVLLYKHIHQNASSRQRGTPASRQTAPSSANTRRWKPYCHFGQGVVTSLSRESSSPPLSDGRGRCALIVCLSDPPAVSVDTEVYVPGGSRTDPYIRNMPTSIDGAEPTNVRWDRTSDTALSCGDPTLFQRLLTARTLSVWVKRRTGRARIDFDVSGLSEAINSFEPQSDMRRQLWADFHQRLHDASSKIGISVVQSDE